ncbi:hypothetical protein [Nonomuraea sp. NPDC049141]|uniref:hypothetical protein n=1 Tax=Nonomuraea sp. NPDC049141 TaxID=3155500 RepID=UPI0033FA51BF
MPHIEMQRLIDQLTLDIQQERQVHAQAYAIAHHRGEQISEGRLSGLHLALGRVLAWGDGIAEEDATAALYRGREYTGEGA